MLDAALAIVFFTAILGFLCTVFLTWCSYKEYRALKKELKRRHLENCLNITKYLNKKEVF